MMHSSVYESGGSEPALTEANVLVAIAVLITEGRIPDKVNSSFRGYSEGPHCHKSKSSVNHVCDEDHQILCSRYEKQRSHVLSLWQKSIPVCVEVLLTAGCDCGKELAANLDVSNGINSQQSPPAAPAATDSLLLEQWYLTVEQRRSKDASTITTQQLLNAVRSQLHFSQLAAWLSIKPDNNDLMPSTKPSIIYRLTIPGETFKQSKFKDTHNQHNFPLAEIGNNNFLKVSMHTLPRVEEIPKISCRNCDKPPEPESPTPPCCEVLDDRMHFSCTMHGKHKCTYDEEDADLEYRVKETELKHKSKVRCLHQNGERDLLCQRDYASFVQNQVVNYFVVPSKPTQTSGFHENVILGKYTYLSKGDILLDAILRSSRRNQQSEACGSGEQMSDTCDNELSDNINKCDNLSSNKDLPRRDRANHVTRLLYENRKELFKTALDTKRKIDFDQERTLVTEPKIEEKECVPSVLDQKKFRKSLDSAASMVFHSRTGLPLTSSPAPIRKGTKCFDFDSKLNSVQAIRSALFELQPNSVGDDDSESDCSAVSPCSPDIVFPKKPTATKRVYKPPRSGLLGTFEESVLHGRLEPVSTVQGFTAELGASGLFCPSHKTFPVTVFFYSLGDMDQMSVPYLGHINLGKKGYCVPKSGLVQLTLFNPLGTVVKMFVISYDLSDMPPNSQTFIRQRTLYLPQNCPELQRPDLEYCDKWGQKYLRFLIHLRFMSSKSGRLYLHTDIRMIIFNKSDMDTATGLTEPGHELRSFIYCPTNPKYSPRK